ncbi:MAG TPA: cupin domain-containing protein [Verrucomicrobiae bacterium]|nr:cupin domain-containing protein [Verrucomicrobiae bacterium]
MKLIDTNVAHAGFKVLARTKRSEAAVMELEPDGSTGGEDNKHTGEDQWLYVVSGTGKAIVAGTEQTLQPGSLLLIEAGETHEISNTGDGVLRTLNFYAPPAY